jgi:RNA polymerase sigma-70 factor, ECF subfamily
MKDYTYILLVSIPSGLYAGSIHWKSVRGCGPERSILLPIELYGRNPGRESLSSQRVLSEQVRAVYNEHHETICRFARLFLGNRGDAEEVAQEIYARLLEGRAALPTPLSRSWLYKVVLNACRDQRKSWWSRLQRSSTDVTVLANLADYRPTPEDAVLDSEREARLMELLRSLPPRLRAPVILRDIEELSYEDIAASLGCGIGTISSRLNRGRKILAHKLHRRTE